MTSTYGTGEMIMDAIQRGCRQFLVGIGGSATNDAGTGMLQAMGFRFYDNSENEIQHCCGGTMHQIARIDDSQVCEEVRKATFTIACDVDTPFCGKEGAAPVFAPQKGADEMMVERLDEGMSSLAQVIENKYGINIVPVAGAGAAGGMGGAFRAFLDAKLQRGVEMVLDSIDFNAIIQDADLIITGEGKIDFQTAKGKTAAGVLARAKAQDIPVVAIAGRVEMCDSLAQMGFAGVYPIMENEMPLAVAMQPDFAAANVEKTVKKIVTNLHIS
jgi:glycerate kinase